MRRGVSRLIVALGALVVLSAGGGAPARAELPPIRHVFVIVLENKRFADTFAKDSPAPYLSQTLVSQGALVRQYYGIGHESLDNYIAMVSGQAPNGVTQADSPAYVDFAPGTPTDGGQFVGQGSVYPAAVKTIADQLAMRGLRWKGYMEDMGNSSSDPQTCRHPAVGSPDNTQSARKGDQYAMRHNPFVYFHSIVDDPLDCNANDVPLDRLPGDLASGAGAPNLAFVTPNLCNDGHDKTCVDGTPGGLPAADAFLRQWVPRITRSAAFAKGGLLLVLFDEAPAPPDSGTPDASACGPPCQSPMGPNTINPGGPMMGPGGGQVGAVALSPYIRPGTVTDRPYNHYSLLRSIEDLFGLGYLGYAGLSGQTAFSADLYTGRPGTAAGPTPCSTGSLPVARRGRLPRGSVIGSLRLRRRGRRHPRLDIVFRHAARLDVRGRPRPRLRRRHPTRRVGPRRVAACRRYRVTLPYRHGTATVRATVGRASERRSFRF